MPRRASSAPPPNSIPVFDPTESVSSWRWQPSNFQRRIGSSAAVNQPLSPVDIEKSDHWSSTGHSAPVVTDPVTGWCYGNRSRLGGSQACLPGAMLSKRYAPPVGVAFVIRQPAPSPDVKLKQHPLKHAAAHSDAVSTSGTSSLTHSDRSAAHPDHCDADERRPTTTTGGVASSRSSRGSSISNRSRSCLRSAFTMRFDLVEKRLAKGFVWYIQRLVVRWPWFFILLPVALTLALSLGFLKNPPLLKDDLSLYTPTDALALKDLALLRKYFTISDADPFYAQRRYDIERYGHIIVTGRPEGVDALAPSQLDSALRLWRQVEQLSVDFKGNRYTYEDLCIRAQMQRSATVATASCIGNPLLQAYGEAKQSANATKMLLGQLRYPVTDVGWFIGHIVGGVNTDEKRYVTGARALLLPYMLRHDEPSYDHLASLWEQKLNTFLAEQTGEATGLGVYWWTSETLAEASAKDRIAMLRLLPALFVALTVFTVLCCFVGSWVRSRPWLGLAGVASAGAAIVSAIGMLLLLDVQFTSVAYSMPFIMFSIGVDNVFILLSSWRAASPSLSLSDRMGATFRDAGVSITVTCLTDGLSFGIGSLATFPSVRIFCIYATVAIAFVYVYQLTFFAGMMVVTGRREVANRHFCTCGTVGRLKTDAVSPQKSVELPRSDAKSHDNKHKKNQRQRSFEDDPSFSNNHKLARFFRTTFADLLLMPPVRCAVILLFAAYLAVAAWGCTKLELGLRAVDLLAEGSNGWKALVLHDEYFNEYGSFLHVYITNLTAHPSDSELLRSLEHEVTVFEHTEFTGYADSWLRVFKAYTNTAGLTVTGANFVQVLKDDFLSQPVYAKYARDIVFDGAGQRLEAVRFAIHLRFCGSSNHTRAMSLFRRLAESSRLPVHVYTDFFLFAEQFDAVLPGTLTNVGLAGLAVIVISLLLIPKPGAALWVSVAIVSINVGILGYMSLWGVRLDFVSMVTIVMSIGFCVDFSAHIAYHFAKDRGKHAGERLRAALYAVGTPILQSAASTILGVSFLALIQSYVYTSFCKTVILVPIPDPVKCPVNRQMSCQLPKVMVWDCSLVVILGAAHGLVVLPVLLTLLFCHLDDDGSEYSAKRSRGRAGSEFSDRSRVQRTANVQSEVIEAQFDTARVNSEDCQTGSTSAGQNSPASIYEVGQPHHNHNEMNANHAVREQHRADVPSISHIPPEVHFTAPYMGHPPWDGLYATQRGDPRHQGGVAALAGLYGDPLVQFGLDRRRFTADELPYLIHNPMNR